MEDTEKIKNALKENNNNLLLNNLITLLNIKKWRRVKK
jgi:hypothetical protein